MKRELRDHSKPCEHGEVGSHLVEWVYCPGGKLVVLRDEMVTIDGKNVKYVWLVEVTP